MSAKRKRIISAIFLGVVLYFVSPYIQRWTNIYVGSLFVAVVAYFWGKYFMFEEEYKEEMEKYNAWLDKMDTFLCLIEIHSTANGKVGQSDVIPLKLLQI